MAPADVRGETLVLEAVAAGSFSDDGGVAVAGGAYIVGQLSFGEEIRNVFIFDVGGVSDPIVAARLRLYNPPDGFHSPEGMETYAAFAVSSDVATLTSFRGGLLAFEDLGSGLEYGAVEATSASEGTFLEIDLGEAAIRALNRAVDEFAIGGALVDLEPDASQQGGRFLFGRYSGTEHPRPQVLLWTDASRSLPGFRVIHVDDGNAGAVEDGSEDHPFDTISEGMDAATPGDRVAVSPGIYPEAVVMRDAVELRGAGSDLTVIDGTAHNVGVRCAPTGSLDGFHVTNVSAAGFGPLAVARVIECLDGASPLLVNNRITGNEATGIFLERSSAEIRWNEISANASFDGSCPCDAIAGIDATPVIEGNRIDATGSNVWAIDLGASRSPAGLSRGFRIQADRIIGPIRLRNLSTEPPGQNAIANNELRSGRIRGETLNIASSPDAGLVANNTSVGGTGFFLQGSSSALIVNNIIAFGNRGITVLNGMPEILHNNVFENRESGVLTFSNYVGIDDQTGTNGNISEDPRFVDRFAGDFHLLGDSPAIDTGTDPAAIGALDLDGFPRVVDGDGDGIATPDMGAFEFQIPVMTVDIAIKPGADRAPINSRSRGLIPVAILGSGAFDVADVDVTTLVFGPGEAVPAHRKGGHREDVDADGLTDLVSHYRTRDAGIGLGDVEACVNGVTLDGRPFEGCDALRVVGRCGIGFELALLLPVLPRLHRKGRGRSGRRTGWCNERPPGLAR